MIERNQLLELDVLNYKLLKKLGYEQDKYYCGPYFCQKFLTSLKSKLESLGVPFIFNKACFKHDKMYGINKGLFDRLRMNFIFYIDLHKLLDHEIRNNNKLLPHRRHLRNRLRTFFILVIVFMFFYKKNG